MRYDGPIIDAHHHLWDIGMKRHPWLVPVPGREMVFGDPSPLHRDYLPADLRADAARHKLAGSVHVEAGWRKDDPVGETRWLAGLREKTGLPTAAVVAAPLDDPLVESVLEQQCEFGFVRGVRFILSWHEDETKRFAARPDHMSDPAWLRGFALLEKFGLSFDLMLYPHQLGDAAALARRFPGTTIIVNHAASPIDRDEAGMARWRAGLALLAAEPNTRIKVSDLVAYDHDWTLASLRPVVLACIDAFGPDRVLFASDFPVAGLHATFDEIYDGFKTITEGFSPAEQKAMFHDNAARDYRLDSLPSIS